MHRKAEITGVGKPFRVVTSQLLPVPPSNSVRIRIAFSGVCHSDVHIWDDELQICKYYGEDKFKGMVLGHEISGYIDQEGEDVHLDTFGLKMGDRVMVFPWVGCQKCSTCIGGYSHICPDPVGHAYDIGCGPYAEGGYQTHLLVKPEYLVKVPDSIPMEVACMLPCSGGTSYSALLKLKEALDFGKITSDKTRLLVIGSGGLGLWAMQLAKAMFGKDNVHIIACDINQSRLDLSRTFGADETVLWDALASVQTNTKAIKGKVNGVLDFVSADMTSQVASKVIGMHGAIVFVGLQGGSRAMYTSRLQQLVLNDVTVRGNRVFSMEEFHGLVDLVAKNRMKYPSLHYYKLDDISDVIKKLKQGQINGRAIIKHDLKSSY